MERVGKRFDFGMVWLGIGDDCARVYNRGKEKKDRIFLVLFPTGEDEKEKHEEIEDWTRETIIMHGFRCW